MRSETWKDSQTIFGMQILDFPDEPALLNCIEIKFIPRRQGSELRAWNIRQGAEKESTDERVNKIRKLQSNQAEQDVCPGWHDWEHDRSCWEKEFGSQQP